MWYNSSVTNIHMLLYFQSRESLGDGLPESSDAPRLQQVETLTAEARFNVRRLQLRQRKEELEAQIGRVMDTAPDGRREAMRQHLLAFQQSYEYWNTPYEGIGTGHHDAFLQNMEQVIDRFSFIVNGFQREYSSIQPTDETLNRIGAGILRRVQGRPLTWEVALPESGDIRLRFENYQDDLLFSPDTVGMGSLRDNGFRIEKDPANPRRITIQSAKPFRITMPDGRTETVQESQAREAEAVRRSL